MKNRLVVANGQVRVTTKGHGGGPGGSGNVLHLHDFEKAALIG
jgi:hypothetical protein